MFKNKAAAQPVSTPAQAAFKPAAKTSAVPSIVSADMTIRGDLVSTGDLQVEGTVIGEVHVGRLVIAEGGTVNGNVVAQNVRVCGVLNGSIRGAMVSLTATARVTGDVHHELLAIEAGGLLEGQSRRIVPENILAAPVETRALESSAAE